MKKFLRPFLASVLAALAAVALTSCIYSPKLEFEPVSGGYAVSVGNAGSQTRIEIPSTYEGLPVVAIKDGGFDECKKLQSIVIPEGVKIIGSRAFEGCGLLTEIVIPDTVERIGTDSFRYCTSLEKVYYGGTPDDWCGISFGAFLAVPTCYGADIYFGGEVARDITLSEGVTEIKDFAFMGCESLEHLVIPEGVTSIGDQAFYGCTSLKSIVIPNSVRVIGDSAFYNCASLTAVDLPDDLQSIGRYTFYNCYSLTSLTLPDKVGVIGDHAFAHCSGLRELTLGDALRSIGDSAFRNCTNIISIEIPADVNNIAKSAFSGCHRLVEVINRSSLGITAGADSYGSVAQRALEVHGNESSRLTVCDSYAFYLCDGEYRLVNYFGSSPRLSLPASCNGQPYSINDYAFFGIGTVTKVIIPDGVTNIGNSAFEDCINLKQADIPGSVERIGYRAFSGCTSLDEMSIPDGIGEIAAYSFHNCTDLKRVSVGNTVTSIGASAFWGCTDLRGVTLGGGLVGIGRAAFYGCDSLTAVTIPEGTQTIAEAAFSGCGSLASIVIPASITEIGDGFLACYRLVEIINRSALKITVGTDTVGGIAKYAMDVHSGESRISVSNDYLFYTRDGVNYLVGYSGDSVVLNLPETFNGESYDISKYAFMYCEDLVKVIIPDAVSAIGREAFSGCISLRSVNVGRGVKRIGEAAFYGCTSLADVYYAGMEAEWNQIYVDWDNAALTKAKRHYDVNTAS